MSTDMSEKSVFDQRSPSNDHGLAKLAKSDFIGNDPVKINNYAF